MGMRHGELDLMIEFAAACLATEDHLEIKKMIRVMARRWPAVPALSIAFAVTSAAASFEEVVESKNSEKIAALAYRIAALVAADAFAVESMGKMRATAQDLLHFWHRVDPYFLKI